MQKMSDIEIKFHSNGDSARNHPLYPGFKPQTILYKRNTAIKDGALDLPCAITKEQDVAVKLRDNTTIYVDVLRPTDIAYPLPAIISWGPFGKNGGFNRQVLNDSPWRSGVPQRTVSGLENFEGLDPAYWCNHGYALVHPDIRGTWSSEGDTHINSDQEGRDGYDLIEWIAEQPWSNGRVTMAGNSWLTQCQWFIGAEKPPHLTCLCPYEGWNDMYNDTTNRGGIPDPGFQAGLLFKACPGLGKTEDVATMAKEHTMWNEYYESRKAKVENINVPMYIVASWTNFLHTRGTFRGYLESYACEKKWLRVHNSHEWPDLYYPDNTEDCRRFLDHYMKDVSNGWEFTPPVRLSILNPGHKDVVNRPESLFPIPRQQSVRMHLDPRVAALTWNEPLKEEGTIQFEATEGAVEFTYTFSNRTELTGFSSLRLFVSSPTNAEDIDLFVNTSKLSPTGQKLETVCIDVGYLQPDPQAERVKAVKLHKEGNKELDVYFAEGPHGRLRVSHRELDEKLTTPHWPRYTHKNYLLLEPKEIVEVVVELWPCGMIWEKGEKLRLTIAGSNLRAEGISRLPPCPTLNMEGSHIALHAGGKYESYLLVPFIPGAPMECQQ